MKLTRALPDVDPGRRRPSFAWVAITLLSAAAAALAVWQHSTVQGLQDAQGTATTLRQDVDTAAARLEATAARLGKAESELKDMQTRLGAARKAQPAQAASSPRAASSTPPARRAAVSSRRERMTTQTDDEPASPMLWVIVR